MTIIYMAIQEALDDPEGMAEVRHRLRKCWLLTTWTAVG